PGVLLGVTGGYIVGFIFTAAIVGGAVSHFGKKIPVYIISMVLGVAVCYIFGTAWFMVWSSTNGSAATLSGALMSCVVPFIVPDLVKIALATLICAKLSKYIRA
uniref:biotin transporter BioY n=1 Tax=Eubacterium sp. TaxID=142586 RepID=UPI004024FCE8